MMLLLLVGTPFLFGSCEKWLNVSPKTQMKAEDMLSNETGYDDLLTGVYSLMTTTDSYGSNLSVLYLDVMAQYYNTPRLSTSTGEHQFKNAAEFKFTESSEEGRIKSIWSTSYKGIVNVNMGLKYIDDNMGVFSSDTTYNIYKGELLALRAMLHFDILRLFGQAPLMNSGSGMNSLSIPYFDNYTIVAQPQRTVKEILDRVVADLEAAKTLMAPYDSFGPISDVTVIGSKNEKLGTRTYRMNYYAATALLARVYLYAGEKAKALEQAKEIVQEPTSDNPKLVFKMTTTQPTSSAPLFEGENIFALNVLGLDKRFEFYFTEKYNSMILTISAEAKSACYDSGGTNSDFRSAWFTETSSKNSFFLSKYNNVKMIPLITVSEVYLIAAESASGADGVKYLNKLRYHRGLNPISESANLDAEIYKEYRREMFGNGQLLFFYKRNLYNTIGPLDNIELNDINSNYVLPIPKLEVEFGKIKN